MDFNRLTLKSQEAIAAAQELARRGGHPEIHPEHLLLALLDQELPQTLLGERGAELRADAEADLERLRLVQRLTTDYGLNLAGVEMVLGLEDQLRRMQRRMDRMERELRERMRDIERQYKRELVLWQEPTLPIRRR